MKRLMLIFLVCTPFLCAAQKKKHYTVMFYNVENLFDTKNDSVKLDDEFTPNGAKKWSKSRYKKKLDHISEVIEDIDKKDLPEIIGLCEVENRKVLEDLIAHDRLKKEDYGIIHEESPDVRGIDVALLYRKKEVEVISHEAITVVFEDPKIKTRDILYVRAQLRKGVVVHIYVNHWPSRRGGAEKSEFKRIEAAQTLRAHIKSVHDVDPNARIMIMGDFNDYPDNASIADTLNVKIHRPLFQKGFYHLLPKFYSDTIGSYMYKGNWNLLDHLIVSHSMMNWNNNKFYTKIDFAKVHKRPYLIDKATGGPSRTYKGKNYAGGYSDHLPVYFELFWNKRSP